MTMAEQARFIFGKKQKTLRRWRQVSVKTPLNQYGSVSQRKNSACIDANKITGVGGQQPTPV